MLLRSSEIKLKNTERIAEVFVRVQLIFQSDQSMLSTTKSTNVDNGSRFAADFIRVF